MTILATAYSDPAREAHWGVLTHGTGDHEPMVYTIRYGEGRVFGTAMGHVDGGAPVGFFIKPGTYTMVRPRRAQARETGGCGVGFGHFVHSSRVEIDYRFSSNWNNSTKVSNLTNCTKIGNLPYSSCDM